MTSSTSDGGQIPWSLTIKFDDAGYSATASTEDGESPVKEFKVDGPNVSFKVPYHGDYYDIKLKLVEDKLAGTWSGGGDSGDTKGTKAPTSPAS